MKKGRSKGGKAGSATSKKHVTISNKTTVIKDSNKKEILDIDDEDVGFGSWLKSGEGIEWMKIFVIGNSITVFLTMSWPHLRKVIEIIKEMIYGEEDSFY